VHSTVAEALAFAVKQNFFEKILEEDLYDNPEQARLVANSCDRELQRHE
jgi:hypothetical protein